MGLGITGKTAIVTGAANGVGLAIAQHFAERGANVMCADRDEIGLAENIGKEHEALRYFAGDLREKLTVANLISATMDAFDGVDILVNASRQVQTTDPFDPEDISIAELLEQNLMTSLRLSQAVAKRMISLAESDKREKGIIGSIINISSIAARRTQPELMGLSISTAALDQATRSLAVALAPHRIRVNGVAFGSVLSASLKASLREDSTLRNAICHGTPMGRIAQSSEVADAAQFLASDGAGFMTGQILTVDGGRTLIDPVEGAAH